MAVIRKRTILALGVALLVGGWGAKQFEVDEYIASATPLSSADTEFGAVISMMLCVALIVAAVLVTTNRKDE